jgi:hypothetical protein
MNTAGEGQDVRFGAANSGSRRTALAACRRIGLLIADAQHENPRGVGKGRLLTPLRDIRAAP